ncbi:MAG: hypothetical protein QGI08_01240 [Paracoccaceae bacterium]|jgi:hypothetical protein|nr:hypothetical protein [Paracoccaceae bacterium]
MQTIANSSNALAFLFGLNWDRIVFLAAVAGALTLAALIFSMQTAAPFSV